MTAEKNYPKVKLFRDRAYSEDAIESAINSFICRNELSPTDIIDIKMSVGGRSLNDSMLVCALIYTEPTRESI